MDESRGDLGLKKHETDEAIGRGVAPRGASTMLGAWNGPETVASSCVLPTQHFPLPSAEEGEDPLLLLPQSRSAHSAQTAQPCSVQVLLHSCVQQKSM